MDNFILAPHSKELEQASQELGFHKTLFLEKDFQIFKGENKKELTAAFQRAASRKQLSFYLPQTEEMLRFVLERTACTGILRVEQIHSSDHLHYIRGGLDQVVCKIAAQKGKIVVFSFSDLLSSPHQAQTLSRMIFNIQLCQKYKVTTLFSTFARQKMELRAPHDLAAVWRVLAGEKSSLSLPQDL